ncbi:hypothetical protein IT568_12625 [bacterium]|nr:hypothetical protein [bacterium]
MQIKILILLSLLFFSCADDSVIGWDKKAPTNTEEDDFVPKPFNSVSNNYIGFRVGSKGSSYQNIEKQSVVTYENQVKDFNGLAQDFGLWFSARDSLGNLKVSVSSYFGSEFKAGPIGYNGSDSLVFKLNTKSNNDERSYREWKKDWNAPYDLITGKPKLFGEEMLWTIFNDADKNFHTLFQTEPLNLVVRHTSWVDGFSGNNSLSRAIFHKFQIENKSSVNFDTLRVGVWIDPELGNSNNDKLGFNTALQFAFAYDSASTNIDENLGLYHSLAVAFLSDTENDTNFFAFPFVDLKDLGNTPNAQNIENVLKGLKKDGTSIIHGSQGNSTKFIFDGNVLTGSGWVDNETDKNARMLCVPKPFSLAPGEEKEIVLMVTICVSEVYSFAVYSGLTDTIREARKKKDFWKNY